FFRLRRRGEPARLIHPTVSSESYTEYTTMGEAGSLKPKERSTSTNSSIRSLLTCSGKTSVRHRKGRWVISTLTRSTTHRIRESRTFRLVSRWWKVIKLPFG